MIRVGQLLDFCHPYHGARLVLVGNGMCGWERMPLLLLLLLLLW